MHPIIPDEVLSRAQATIDKEDRTRAFSISGTLTVYGLASESWNYIKAIVIASGRREVAILWHSSQRDQFLKTCQPWERLASNPRSWKTDLSKKILEAASLLPTYSKGNKMKIEDLKASEISASILHKNSALRSILKEKK